MSDFFMIPKIKCCNDPSFHCMTKAGRDTWNIDLMCMSCAYTKRFYLRMCCPKCNSIQTTNLNVEIQMCKICKFEAACTYFVIANESIEGFNITRLIIHDH